MNKDRIKLKDVFINYMYNDDSGGDNIIFIHGNSLSSKSFEEQFSDLLLEDFNLFAIDLPGHGESDRSKNPENDYNLPGYASVVKELIENLGLDNVLLVGHSLGGHVALEVCKDIQGLRGVVIFGTPPLGIPPNMEGAFHPNPAMQYAFTGDLSIDEATILANEFAKDANSDRLVGDILNTDPLARAFMGASVGQLNYSDELQIVKSMHVPLAIINGSSDPLINQKYLEEIEIPSLWKSKVVEIASGHSPQLEIPDEFNGLVKEFCSTL